MDPSNQREIPTERIEKIADALQRREPITDRINRKTGIVIQAGVVVGVLVTFNIWMHQRVTSLELEQASRSERDKYIMKQVDFLVDHLRGTKVSSTTLPRGDIP